MHVKLRRRPTFFERRTLPFRPTQVELSGFPASFDVSHLELAKFGTVESMGELATASVADADGGGDDSDARRSLVVTFATPQEAEEAAKVRSFAPLNLIASQYCR